MVLEPDNTNYNSDPGFLFLVIIIHISFHQRSRKQLLIVSYHTLGIDSSWTVIWTAGTVYSFNIIT